ncbi:MAG TPA: prepilin-type N-terminal cleavage/methylation domain-containing protein [Geobacteraceae bacterium]|nr:prepilin-type N-terminal cleavage/methylation domain-containing protein [Geobacteraceae bacterium]
MNIEPGTAYRAGFTLIEMAVVIVIISLVAMLVLPLLPSTDAASLRSSARSLAAVVRYLGDRSVTTKSPYRMLLDLTDNTITVKKIVNGEEVAPEDPFFARKFLADGVTIEDVEVPRLGKVGEGVVSMDFGVSGLGDFTIIHLKGVKESHFTITALPGGGRVDVREGYQEEKL